MAPELKEILNECFTAALPYLAAAVSALAGYGLVLLRAYLKAKVAAIENRQLREGVEHAMSRLDFIAGTIVADLNQRAKQYTAGRKLTPEEAQKLKTLAVARIRQQLPGYLADTLKEAVGDLEKYLSAKVEQKVFEQKPLEQKPCAP
jgi:hypothetical protein